METREYLVGVTVIEARNIKGKDDSGTSDPYVKVSLGDQVQITKIKFKTNNIFLNQTFTFEKVMLNQYELETFELILEIYD